MVSEFIGTFFFLFFAFFAANIANINGKNPPPGVTVDPLTVDTNKILFIASEFAASICVNIFIFGRISGGLFNPAVTFAFYLAGILELVRAVLLFVTQIIAAIAASAVVDGLVGKGLYVTVGLGGDINVVKGFFIETFFTAQLILTIFIMAVEKHDLSRFAPFVIALSIFIAHIGSIYYTGTGINPARAFGPAVVTGTFPSYHWIYWIGPFFGAILATGLYAFLKYMKYEEVAIIDEDLEIEISTPQKTPRSTSDNRSGYNDQA